MKNKRFHDGSIRAKWWDYTKNGTYHITFNTLNRVHYFGEIQNGEMRLSSFGEIVWMVWKELPIKYPYAIPHVFMVMPEHVHALISIQKVQTKENKNSYSKSAITKMARGGFTGDRNPVLRNDLSTVMRWLKGRIKFECRKIDPAFEWQPLFRDNIVTSKREFDNVKRYIETNPERWKG